MKLITALNGDSNQVLRVTLDDGTQFQLSLTYSSNQLAWFYSVVYGNFSVNNRRLVVSPNMLRAFRNILPFGISCVSPDGREAIYQTDLTSGRISLSTLNTNDVIEAETLITLTIPQATGVILN